MTRNQRALTHLKAVDPILCDIINRIGLLEPKWPSMTPYEGLVKSIVSQQISTSAAATIYRRLVSMLPDGIPSEKTLSDLSDDQLRSAGLSWQKMSYLRGISTAVRNGTLRLDQVSKLADEEIISTLTELKGIGRWSAEIFLMSVLRRPDVLPSADLGLLTAIQREYGLEKRPRPREFQNRAEPWRPWRTLACLYLWQSLRS